MRTKMRSMKVLITGICGFVGNALARRLVELADNLGVFGIDNLMRPGSETNRRLKTQKIRIFHGDIRCASDLETLPSVDFVIDAAANPSVLAGVDGKSSSRQLLEHNLMGTLNLLEFCRREHAGFILLSTSRVYSIKRLSSLPSQSRGLDFSPGSKGNRQKESHRMVFRNSSVPSLQSPFTARANLPRRLSPLSTEKRLISRSGSIGAASSRERGSLGRLNKVFSLTGSMVGNLGRNFGISVFGGRDSKFAMPFIRMILRTSC